MSLPSDVKEGTLLFAEGDSKQAPVGQASACLLLTSDKTPSIKSRQAEQAAEKLPTPFVILSEAKNLSFFSWA
jgi:hypothetical protein